MGDHHDLQERHDAAGVFEGNPLRWPISTVWTLRYELICYGGLLAYGVLGGFRRPVVMLAGAAAAALALVVLAMMGPVPKGQETALRLPLIFACGSLRTSIATGCR